MKKLIKKLKLVSDFTKVNNWRDDKSICIISREKKSYLYIFNNYNFKNSKVFNFGDAIEEDVKISLSNFNKIIKILELSKSYKLEIDSKENLVIITKDSKITFAASIISKQNNVDFYNTFNEKLKDLKNDKINNELTILDLISILNKSVKVCSKNLSKPKMSKILIDSKENYFNIVAADAFLLYHKKINLNLTQKGDFLFNREELETFIKFLKKQDKKSSVKIDIQDNKLFIIIDKDTYCFNSEGDTYVSYQNILPTNNYLENNYKSCIFNKKDIVKLLKKASITISKDSPILRFDFINNTLQTNDEFSNQLLKLKPIENNIKYANGIGLSLKYLDIILKLVDTENIEIKIKDESSVIVVNDFITMPMCLD